MKIKEICELLDAEVLLDPVGDSVDFKCACGADLMSDVLAYVKHDALLPVSYTHLLCGLGLYVLYPELLSVYAHHHLDGVLDGSHYFFAL